MPFKETGNETYDVKRLWGQQKEILRLVASGLYTNKEIANTVGVTPQTVSHIINSALGKQTIEMLQGAADADTVDLMKKIHGLAPIALSIQEEILLEEDTSKSLKNKMADKILDRAGYTPISKNLNLNANMGVNADDLEAIKKRAEELARVRENIKDVEVVE